MFFINSIKVLILYSTIMISGFFGFFFAITPAVPFILLNRRTYFRWCSFVMGYFLLMITALLEDLLNIKIVVTGDDLSNDKKRSIILLNHRTRLDWMYVWMLHSRYNILKQLKIVLKGQLKHIPFLGWSLQHVGYLFVERIWAKDQQKMKSMISYYKSCETSLSLLIFPEGTNLSDETKLKSNNYASKQTTYNRPYEYCLHPHITGFAYLLNTMRSDDMIDNVDDVIIAYEGDFPVTEIDLLKGVLPKVVHFHVKRFSINELPQDDEQVSSWLQQRWEEKENQLKEFYTKKQFDSPSNRFNDHQIESNIRFKRRLALILWILFILFWSYCIFAYIKIKLYVLIVCLFHLVIEVFTDGIISCVCLFDGNSQQKRPTIKQD